MMGKFVTLSYIRVYELSIKERTIQYVKRKGVKLTFVQDSIRTMPLTRLEKKSQKIKDFLKLIDGLEIEIAKLKLHKHLQKRFLCWV